MKKKYLLFSLIVLILAYIVYKVVMIQVYKSEHVEIDNSSIFNSTLKTTHEDSDNLIKFNDMYYKDSFTDFKEHENSEFKVKFNDEGKAVAFYSIAKEEQYINMLSMNSFELFTEEESKKVDDSTEKNMKKMLDKNNIKDDIGLLKYIKENYYLKNNLLTLTNTMRNNYIINTFIQVAFSDFNNITLIEGDLNGYIVDVKSNIKIKEIHLLINNDQYIITLSGEEITEDEFINSLLKTIKFN